MKPNIDAIIFDIDGVLVGNEAFTEATCRTVASILLESKNMKVTVTPETISAIKSIPGFNNDWDTSYALVDLLGRNFSPSAFAENISPLTDAVRNSRLYKRIKTRFQSIYVGKTYDGCITNESLLIDKTLLADLKESYRLGIATGRPKNEAIFSLTRLGITPTYIPMDYIVALEDTVNGKPAPDPLLEASRRMNASYPVYIGDTINDVIAAKAADMPSIYVGNEKVGDNQIPTINNLKEVI